MTPKSASSKYNFDAFVASRLEERLQPASQGKLLPQEPMPGPEPSTYLARLGWDSVPPSQTLRSLGSTCFFKLVTSKYRR